MAKSDFLHNVSAAERLEIVLKNIFGTEKWFWFWFLLG